MNFDNDKAIYLQISDLICENILIGKWNEEDRIPSVRDFAISLEVNPNTVNRTYTHLQEKNIIYNQRGIGYYVSKDAKDNVLNIMREDFINNELPKVTKKMKLLNISVDDFKEKYVAL